MAESQLVSTTRQAGCVIVRIAARELRSQEITEAVKTELIDAIMAEGSDSVILDLQPLTFISSVGLVCFLSVLRVPGIQRIILCNLTENIRDVFLICRLLSEIPTKVTPFEYAKSIDDAVALLACKRGASN